MIILAYLHANCAMWQPRGHVKSSKVTIFFFLLIPLDRRELQQHTRSHCVQLIKTQRIRYILTLRSRYGHVTLGQPLTLPDDVVIYIFWCVFIRGYRWNSYFCSSTISSKVIDKKTVVFKCHYFDLFLTLITSPLTWPKNDLIKTFRYCPPVSNAVYRLSLPCLVF